MSDVVCYVSGHGFGHAARVIEVLRVLRRERPATSLSICSPLDRWFFDFNLGGEFEYRRCVLDTGVVQADSISVDIEATWRAYGDLVAAQERLVGSEVSVLARARPGVVLADIPALAFDVADRLGVPGVGLTNFSWDWIYADYVDELSGFGELVQGLRESYGKSSLLLRLPMHGDLSAFPTARDIPLVARVASVQRDEVRRRLAFAADRRIVLLSFGGIGLPLSAVPDLPGVTFVRTQKEGTAGSLCRDISHAEMSTARLRYEDLVGAADVVMTKPGYGIVAECIANGTPILYTTRGRFIEYECLVEGIRTHLPSAFISNEDLRSGRWKRALDEVLAQPRRHPHVRTDGADVAAEVLAGFLSGAAR